MSISRRKSDRRFICIWLEIAIFVVVVAAAAKRERQSIDKLKNKLCLASRACRCTSVQKPIPIQCKQQKNVSLRGFGDNKQQMCTSFFEVHVFQWAPAFRFIGITCNQVCRL